MKKFKIFYFMFVVAFLLISCSKDEQICEQQFEEECMNDETSSLNDIVLLFKCYGNPIIPEDEVLKIAAETPMQFSSSLSKIGKSIANYKKVNFKSGISKSSVVSDSIPVYFVEYEGTGFAIISGDKRLPQVLAFASEGSYDDVNGSGYVDFINRLPLYVQYTVDSIQSSYEKKKDSLLSLYCEFNTFNSLKKIGSYDNVITKGPWQETLKDEVHGPLIKTKWHQNYPFNDQTPMCSLSGHYHHCPVGCVAIAIGQIIAYHQYPKSINGYNLNWNKILEYNNGSGDRYGVAKLCKEIGQLVNMNYNCKQSGSNIFSAHECFVKLNYKAELQDNYNFNSVYKSIINNRPVYIRGVDTVGNGSGHAWVIDGTRTLRRKFVTQVVYMYHGKTVHTEEKVAYSDDLYVSCNYGHGGKNDGWYISGAFSEYLDRNFWFTSNMKIITNVSPNN